MKKKTLREDKVVDLVDVPEIKIKEDKYGNLILIFKKSFNYEKGDTIKVWSSFIKEKGKRGIIEEAIKKIEEELSNQEIPASYEIAHYKMGLEKAILILQSLNQNTK